MNKIVLDFIFHPFFMIPFLMVLLGVFFYYLRINIGNARIKESLRFSLYEVVFPRSKEARKEGETFRDKIALMEQFYLGLSGLGSHFTLEIASPATENETNFYVSVPRENASLFEKQAQSIFPEAEVREEKSDYNIFKYKGKSVGSVLLLNKNNILPFKTYEDLKSDPLEMIANTFSGLSRDKEGAAVQIVVDPSDNSFKDSVAKAIKNIEGGASMENIIAGSGSNFWDGAQKLIMGGVRDLKSDIKSSSDPMVQSARTEFIELLRKKHNKPIMRMNIRLLASAQTQDRARGILSEMKSAFAHFTEPLGNSFTAYDVKGTARRKLFYDFSMRIFNRKRVLYLNTEELSSVFHFPAFSVDAPRVKTLALKKAQPPNNLSTEGVLLGKNLFRDKETDIYLSADDRRRHFYTIGQTGTGKSALLKNMAVQDIADGKGVCFIDPHGSDIEDILGTIPQERWDDVVYFNPGDTNRPLALNMLEYNPAHPEQKTFVVNELFEIFNKLYDMSTAGGPMFEQYFRNAALLVMEDPASGSTLLEISRVLSDERFRHLKLSHTNNPVVKNFWLKTAEKAGGEAALQNIVPYITSKFDTFLANEIMRPILVQEKSSFDFREIMDKKKIFLVNLSKGQLGETNAHLLGMILIGKIFMAAMSRVDMPENFRQDFYLYIDEFQNVTTNSIAMILSEARKYRLNLSLAHQFVGQLEEDIKKAVFGNVGSMAAFRIGVEDAEYLEKYFQPIFNLQDLSNVPNYNAHAKILIGGETSPAFNLQTYPPEPSDEGIAEQVKEISAVKYGRSRQEVEAEISRKYSATTLAAKEKEKPPQQGYGYGEASAKKEE